MDDLGIPDRSKTVLLIVDVQEKFRPAIWEFDRIVSNARKLIQGFKLLGIPIVYTEQYPKGLGSTVRELAEHLEGRPIEKIEFSCFNNPNFFKKIKELGAEDLVICGIEAHVCILQTVLDALDNGFRVHLVVDAVSSRNKADYDISMKRARDVGAFVASTEMILFQMMKSAQDPKFKEVQKIVK